MNSLFKTILKRQHLIMLLILVTIAFVRNAGMVKGLHYGYDIDCDRDLGNVENLLEGNIGQDPSYLKENMWYNPLVVYIESAIIKITGISAATFSTQAGAFLNIFSPLFFYLMVAFLFNSRIAIVSTTAFLFFSTALYAPTYSPWLYPIYFMQALFYLGVWAVCKAFVKPGYLSFFLAGIVAGIAFLGHTAPAVILLLVASYLFYKEFRNILKKKSLLDLGHLIRYAIVFFTAFVLASFPLLYFVVGKYKLQMVNMAPSQYMFPIFYIQNLLQLMKENLSVFLLIAIAGACLFFFDRNEEDVKRNILLGWLFTCIVLFAYTTIEPSLKVSYGILLPGIVPSFHFFFYLKALQYIFFGIAVCRIADWVLNMWFKGHVSENTIAGTVSVLVLILSVGSLPDYWYRREVMVPRETGLERNKQADEIEIYHFLLNKTNINDVVVCEENNFGFPVMASGRKMVATAAHFSNPYLNYEERDHDRDLIMDALIANKPESVSGLLKKYHVKFILIENTRIKDADKLNAYFLSPVFKNEKFSVYLNKKNGKG